jgi:hypothetical protein
MRRKLLPLVHLATIWVLVAYFVFFQEPKAFQTHGTAVAAGRWSRWAKLGSSNAKAIDFLEIQVMPFFWVFMSLQAALHTIRIVYKYDEIQPTGLFAVVISHLPPAVSMILLHGQKYVQMGGMFLDDVAGVIVGLGLAVWVGGWLKDSD